MSRRDDPPFLERALYRAKRVQDAARVLPVFGAVLFALPMLWAAGRTGSTVRSGLYLFAAWGVLILVAFLLSRLLSRARGSEPNG